MWQAWLLGAAALHLGFQATVTVLVYPALVDAGRRGDGWAALHTAHSRRITPVVVLVYGVLLLAVAVTSWRLVAGTAGWGGAVAVLGALVAFAATATVAAPAHRALARGWDDEIGVRLVRADAVRLAGALVCLAGAAASA